MISFSRRFIYVHIFKAGGTSIERALGRHSIDHSARERLGMFLSAPFDSEKRSGLRCLQLGNHARIRDYSQILGRHLSNFFSFTFVRNPYDWEVSHFEYIRSTPTHFQNQEVLKMDFTEYVEWRCTNHRTLQKSFVCDSSGNPVVDFIGRFETLAQDFALVCARLGVQASLPHMNARSHGPANQYFSPALANRYFKAFEEDFSLFGYPPQALRHSA